MALMIPDYTTEFTTQGERRFFEFLLAFAKPDEKFTTWYTPDIGGREPDFILYCENLGLIVFEVKDWALDQIEEADPHSFVIRAGMEKRRLKSPLQQAREYLNSLMDRIKADRRLISKDPRYLGKPKIPIDCGVVFPNIRKSAYCGKGLEKVIDTRHIFFSDDLHFSSEICNDGSGRCFQARLMEMFPPRFSFRLTGIEYNSLKQLLFPVIRVNHSVRENTCIYVDPSERVHVLDDRQESIAKRLVPEVNVIRGPSGSGKTLVLVHRAAFIKAYKPAMRVLFLCYNVTLVNYLKRLFVEKKTGLGPGGVEVHHFFEFCSRILGEPVQYENESGEYYQLVIEETLSKLKDAPVKYDAVLIDESQDFSAGMLEIVGKLLGEGSPWLTMAIDDTQNLYACDFFSSLQPVSTNPRIDDLSAVYRSTVEIREFAAKYAGHGRRPALACDFNGPKPELVRASDIRDSIRRVADTIRTLNDAREYPLSEMAVLYAKRLMGKEKISVPEVMISELESRGIMTNWVSQDYRSKLSFDITTERVCLSTVHSAKGLDWACVFIVGLDELATGSRSDEYIEKLAYVAITRARHRLFIPYTEKNRLIEKLIKSL